MLPSYNAYNRRHPYHSLSRPTHAASSLRDRLLSRSRVTNLGLILIGCILGFSLLSNLRYILLLSESKLRAPTIPPLIADTVSYNSSESQLDHLIVVAGHAIWKGVSPLEYEKDSEWVLDVAQAGHGNPRAFYAHIAKGYAPNTTHSNHSKTPYTWQCPTRTRRQAQLASFQRVSQKSCRVESFNTSGCSGQTRKPTHLTEAQSYLSLALSTGLLPLSASSGPFERATTEDFALDSFQNLLFSVARFRERTGWYPRRITVVGFGVKKERFEKLHARAIRWPVRMFKYVGVDVDGQGDLEASRAGEVRFFSFAG